jgi:hypothetical protein
MFTPGGRGTNVQMRLAWRAENSSIIASRQLGSVRHHGTSSAMVHFSIQNKEIIETQLYINLGIFILFWSHHHACVLLNSSALSAQELT